MKRSTPELASIYDEGQGEEERRVTKRSRMSSIDNDDEERVDIYANDDNEPLTSTVLKKLPINFHSLINPLFQEYWSLEFSDQEVNWAFFAKITSLNCQDFRLQAFAPQSTSLAVIKVRCHFSPCFMLPYGYE